jgi:hypothetical protein
MFAAGKTAAVASAANYIEDVFSTYLYVGNGNATSRTIQNNIDLSTYGGMVWIKSRSGAYDHDVTDTARGARNPIFTNKYLGQDNNVDYAVNSFLTNGFTLASTDNLVNRNSATYASWTFRKQPKFFDVVTYTGDGTSTKTISHSLNAQPGMIIIKSTTAASMGDWATLVRNGNTYYTYMYLNSSAGAMTSTVSQTSAASSTTVNVGWLNANLDTVNASGVPYVAYLFAHNAGGFGLTGTDNVISCGSFTTDGNGTATVDIGYEPQWILYKATDLGGTDWTLIDNMRGMSLTSAAALYADLSYAESIQSAVDAKFPTATGFTINGEYASRPYIYIAIRRGPMKVPTDATKVFTPATRTGTGSAATITSAGFPIDLIFSGDRSVGRGFNWDDRLSGPKQSLRSWSTAGYTSDANGVTGFDSMTGLSLGDGQTFGGGYNVSGETYVYEMLRRAPSFFDVVCRNSPSNTVWTHNLGVKPDLIILKCRSAAFDWLVDYCSALPNAGTYTDLLRLNTTAAVSSNGGYSTVASINATSFGAFLDSANWVAYLFATCPGVSKVGSYTGNGTTQTIDCGFTGGARFVLIKRTDSTGDWYVYDTARGMTTLTDPYLLLNSSAAETATLGSVTTVSTGFAVDASILAAINTNGASYIYLSIA